MNFLILNIFGTDEFIDVTYQANEVDKFKIYGSSFDESVCKTKFNATLEYKWFNYVECQCAAGKTLVALNGEVPTCQVKDGSKNIFGK